jgi:hypothetical protein
MWREGFLQFKKICWSVGLGASRPVGMPSQTSFVLYRAFVTAKPFCAGQDGGFGPSVPQRAANSQLGVPREATSAHVPQLWQGSRASGLGPHPGRREDESSSFPGSGRTLLSGPSEAGLLVSWAGLLRSGADIILIP